MNWPENPTDHPLGDGRFAVASERPETLDALKEIVARRASEGLALYPQGGRTSLDYGGVPRRPGVAIDMTALKRVVDYPAADMTITVEAGMTLSELQATLDGQGQRLPLDAPQPERATLGGIFATNTSGPRRFGWGRPRDLIIGVRFVTADAKVVKGGGRVVKNVAGYDFPKLLTGSMGTLGILSELTLKVRPKPEASAIGWAAFANARDVSEVLDRLNTSRTRPVALELFSRRAAEQVGAGLGLPLDAWVLAVGLEDNAASVAWQRDALRPELEPGSLSVLEGAAAEPLWNAMANLPALELGPLGFVANLRPSAVVEFCERLHPDRWLLQAHAGNGMVRGQFLGNFDELPDLASEIEAIRHEAVAAGGNLILSRCPTPWKERFRVWGEPRGDWPLMEQIKHALDPGAVLNPGRFVATI